jgi:glycosyltransferase involved in cell wall biosynthesis
MPDYVDKMIIVDDASSDKTHQIAREYQKKKIPTGL